MPAYSGDIVFKPLNPSFGGSSFNSAHLLGLANAQNQPKRKAEEKAKAEARAAAQARQRSQSDRFVQLLQSRLYSSLAGQVSEAIFGENAQDDGRIVFQDQEVTWTNNGTEIVLNITDFSTGQTSEVIIPTVTQ